MSCWDCRFYEPHGTVDLDVDPEEECHPGDCHLLPPVTNHGKRDTPANWACQPMVIASDWCGFFQPRDPVMPSSREDEANAEFNAAARDDAPDAAVSTTCGKCDRLPE